MSKKALLICGILESIIRIINDVVAAMLYPGYSFRDQTMSQLAAVGAPTRELQLKFFIIEPLLIILFAIGVWISSGKKRSLRICGALLSVFGALLGVELLFPQTSMQLSGGFSDQVIHIVVTGTSVILIWLFIGFGAAALGKGFRLYSIATILMMLIFGAMAGSKVSQAVEFSAPWMGAMERVNYYSYLIWMFVFAVILLKTLKTRNPT